MGFFERRCRIKPYEGKEDYIFISYSHKDKEKVFPVIERMVDDGFRVWFDEGIVPGEEWTKTIAEHLNGCSVFFAFVSENSLESKNCTREINFAIKKDKYFVTVMLEDTELPPEIDMQLSPVQMISRYKFRNEEDFFEKLYSVENLNICIDAAATEEKNDAPEEKSVQEESVGEIKAPDDIVTEEKTKIVRVKEKKKRTAKERSRRGGRKRKIKRVILALFLTFAVSFVCITAIALIFGNDAYVSVSDVTENMLWGEYEADGLRNNKQLFTILKEDEPYTVYLIPSAFSISPEADGVAELEYTDEFGAEFTLKACYELSDKKIEFSPYLGTEDEKEEFSLAQEVKYKVDIVNGRPVFSEYKGEGYVEYYNSAAIDGNTVIIEGKADADNAYNDVREISIRYDTESSESEISVAYADGKALGIIGSWYRFSGNLSASWSKEERHYNGRTEVFSLTERKYLKGICVNTYPYGFVFIAEDDGEVYVYQVNQRTVP